MRTLRSRANTAASASSSSRRDATKNQIMNALLMSEQSTRSNANVNSTNNGGKNRNSSKDKSSNDNQAAADSLLNSMPKKEQLDLMVQELQEQLEHRIQLIRAMTIKGLENQKQCVKKSTVKLKKSIRTMTIAEFDQEHNCHLLSLLGIVNDDDESNKNNNNSNDEKDMETEDSNSQQEQSNKPPQPPMAKKRIRPNNFETPFQPKKAYPSSIPTIMRTARKGEALFSKNGSPIDMAEEGTLVATIAKKRRGNERGRTAKDGHAEDVVSAMFDIHVGDGRFINLSEPGTIQNLDQEMKDAAIGQLEILRGQMNQVLAQLNNRPRDK